MFLPNALITYEEFDNVPLINAITGEVQFTNSLQTYQIQVSIEEESLPNTISALEGKDITGIVCSGRLVIPREVPEWYRVGGEYEIVYKSNKKAKWYAMQPVSSRLGLEAVFGVAIIGIIFTV